MAKAASRAGGPAQSTYYDHVCNRVKVRQLAISKMIVLRLTGERSSHTGWSGLLVCAMLRGIVLASCWRPQKRGRSDEVYY